MAVVFTVVIFDNNQAGMALSRLYFWRLEAGGKSRQPADEIEGAYSSEALSAGGVSVFTLRPNSPAAGIRTTKPMIPITMM